MAHNGHGEASAEVGATRRSTPSRGEPGGDGAHSGGPPPSSAGAPSSGRSDPRSPAPAPAPNGQRGSNGFDGACTAPQLRRFIKSRAYVPMHELRRRFGINGADDDVTPVAVDGSLVYVGLPSREGSLLGELLRAGEVGFELSMDPVTPIIVGVYPMRPVPRQ